MSELDRLLQYVRAAKKAAAIRSMLDPAREHYEGQAAAYQDVENVMLARIIKRDNTPDGQYLIESSIIDILYRAVDAAHTEKAITDGQYLAARDELDELAQTHKDGTKEPHA